MNLVDRSRRTMKEPAKLFVTGIGDIQWSERKGKDSNSCYIHHISRPRAGGLNVTWFVVSVAGIGDV